MKNLIQILFSPRNAHEENERSWVVLIIALLALGLTIVAGVK